MARARSVRSEHRDRLRAQMVLAAAAGKSNAAIAGEAGVCTDTVRKWRRRFAAARLAGLRDAPRSGRPPVFTAADRAEAVALACALPAESGVPLSRWSCPELARELATRCQVAASASSIRRILAADVLKPWQHQSWIFIRDPAFPALGPNPCSTSTPAPTRAQPSATTSTSYPPTRRPASRPAAAATPPLAPRQARAMRVNDRDHRPGGALADLAAYDVHRAKVFGRCEATTGIAPFMNPWSPRS